MLVDVLVINATIHQQPGFFKPDPYVELCVDEQSPPRKTEVIAKSLSPTWNEHFTVSVIVPASIIHNYHCYDLSLLLLIIISLTLNNNYNSCC